MSRHFPDQAGFVPASEARIRQTATVMLLREGPQGPEVSMMKRTSRVDFGGLHVLPGGKVDPHAAHGEMLAREGLQMPPGRGPDPEA